MASIWRCQIDRGGACVWSSGERSLFFSPGYSCSKNLGRPQVWEGQDAIEYDQFKDFRFLSFKGTEFLKSFKTDFTQLICFNKYDFNILLLEDIEDIILFLRGLVAKKLKKKTIKQANKNQTNWWHSGQAIPKYTTLAFWLFWIKVI